MKYILYLPLKQEWYRMIEEFVKNEEYREITPYWIKRLFWEMKPDADGAYDPYPIKDKDAKRMAKDHLYLQEAIRCGKIEIKPYTHVEFTLGYPKKSDTNRRMRRKILGVKVGTPREEWCPQEAANKEMFVIMFNDENERI